MTRPGARPCLNQLHVSPLMPLIGSIVEETGGARAAEPKPNPGKGQARGDPEDHKGTQTQAETQEPPEPPETRKKEEDARTEQREREREHARKHTQARAHKRTEEKQTARQTQEKETGCRGEGDSGANKKRNSKQRAGRRHHGRPPAEEEDRKGRNNNHQVEAAGGAGLTGTACATQGLTTYPKRSREILTPHATTARNEERGGEEGERGSPDWTSQPSHEKPAASWEERKRHREGRGGEEKNPLR